MSYSFNEIRLDKGMYGIPGKSFTQVLENLDPSENYVGTPVENLDAFQRQLKRFDIHVKGAGSDMVEKFFQTTDSAVLFPEYVSRAVRAGMEEGNILPSIIATTTRFDGLDYRSVYTANTDDEKSLRKVGEGALIPATEIKTSDHSVRLHKRGRMLIASYEAIRFQRLDLFGVMLRQIGAQIMRMHLEDAIDILINGDGNNNAAAAFTVGDAAIGGTAGSLSYSDLVAFWNQFDPYTMNTMLASPDVTAKILACDEFCNPLTGLNFPGTGEPGSPLGAKLLRSSAVPAGTLIGLDHRYALEMVQAGDVSVEYDRLIDRQLERAAITSISGFAKLYTEASNTLTV